MARKKSKKTEVAPPIKERKHYNVDFSVYAEHHFPLDACQQNGTLMFKTIKCLAFLASTENPTLLQRNGYCKTMERLYPGQDKDFLRYFDLPQCTFFYLSFGRNKMGIGIAVDSVSRTIYVLAIDDTHGIRAYHGKRG